MEMIRKARKFEMVDETGIIRELTVTVESMSPESSSRLPCHAISTRTATIRNSSANMFPRTQSIAAWIYRRSKERSAEDDERCSQTYQAKV